MRSTAQVLQVLRLLEQSIREEATSGGCESDRSTKGWSSALVLLRELVVVAAMRCCGLRRTKEGEVSGKSKKVLQTEMTALALEPS